MAKYPGQMYHVEKRTWSKRAIIFAKWYINIRTCLRRQSGKVELNAEETVIRLYQTTYMDMLASRMVCSLLLVPEEDTKSFKLDSF